MINYNVLEFCAAPKTGTTWFVTACHIVGLGTGGYPHIPFGCREVHEYFPYEESDLLRVSIVRHPCDWLASYYNTVLNARVGCLSDKLGRLAKQFGVESFDEFVRAVLDEEAGIVGKIFEAYEADVFLKTHSLNTDFCELMRPLGIDENLINKVKDMPPHNSITQLGKNPVRWNSALKERFIESERDLMSRYAFSETLVV